MPSTVPRIRLKTTPTRPMVSEIWLPNMMRENMSRPWRSVPSKGHHAVLGP